MAMETHVGSNPSLPTDDENDLQEAVEEEWIRLSKYLHQFQPEIQYLQDVLTWKNARHSMAVFLIINSVFLWMERILQSGFISRLETEEQLFNIDKVSQLSIRYKEIVVAYVRSRNVQPLQFWSILIASTCTVYALLYHITRKLLLGYVLSITLFFTPYIIHHQVLKRLVDFLPKFIDRYSKPDASQDGETSIFAVDSSALCKETDDQVMASSLVSIGEFEPSGLNSVNKESDIEAESEEISNSQIVDNPPVAPQLSQQSDIGNPDIDSLHEFYPIIDANGDDSKSDLPREDRERLTKEALDPETDSLLDFYPPGLDRVDSAKVHRLETHKEVPENSQDHTEQGQMEESDHTSANDINDYVIVEPVDDQEICDSYQPAISQNLFPITTTVTTAQPSNVSVEQLGVRAHESSNSPLLNSSFSTFENEISSVSTANLSDMTVSNYGNNSENGSTQISTRNDEYEIIKHSEVSQE
ncbi:uncharacterized protein TRIADDRAFT_54871 [Trichoplax adhaerens]|uniref:Reticulon domain-containing protein n=1 Tax=Trichoplax adhaerens TaxID=10228 RepID=B3RT82_TRIAD|nr:predicted protein [Trichoplax adhaerens]EDV26652.1 predicted protein [Trichoplax adhaerens]|eukprot:XP_002110648.1 predicted protein [Trichoplax adhaerens]